MAILLHGRSFRTKSEAYKFFSKMLNSYSDLEFVSNEDQILLSELLTKYHPNSNEKVGIGIRRIFRDIAPEGQTSCFYLERTDNTKEDFSFRWCIRSATKK